MIIVLELFHKWNSLFLLLQIVMRYYGGREISEEDLERALLVGMSPRERRRHAKKRGLSLKMSKPTDFPDRQQDSYPAVMVESATMDATKADNVLGLHAIETQKSGEKEGRSSLTESHESKPPTCSNGGIDQLVFSTIWKKMNSTSKVSDSKDDSVGNVDDECENSSVQNGFGSSSPTPNSKVSLLGHGPHGKQVVDYLLREYGEDGIRQFCQRWRQVFVEALHPHFLPAGWDVMHRYNALLLHILSRIML